MKDNLELPPELAHLIEKRDQDDRRGAAEPMPPIVDSPLTDNNRPAPENGERRSGVDRRRN